MKNQGFSNSNLLKWIIFLPVIGVLMTSFILTNIYINSIHKTYEDEVSKLEKNYINESKQKIKNRINNVSNTIDTNYDYQINESKQMVKHFVNMGHSLLNTIYMNNKDKSRKEIYKIINDQMKEIRFFDNKSGYFFIYDAKDGVSISLPASPSFVGKSLINLEDKNGKNLFNSYEEIISRNGEGFDSWYWNKPNSTKKTKKVGYVKIFQPLNIIIGTAIYEEDIQEIISKNVIKIIEKLKFQDDAYIFVIHKKGTVISHKNKNILNKPLKKLSPIVQKNVNAIINKLNNQNEAFIEYTQDQKLLNKYDNSKKISYILFNKNTDWIIGTGLYTSDMKNLVKEKKLILEKNLKKDIKLIILIAISLSLIIVAILMFISKKLKNTILYYAKELSHKNNELKTLNTDLEDKIDQQVKKLREQDLFFNQQSKLIAMGEMIGNIAHQWRQPLSAISTLASGIKVRKELNVITDKEINQNLDNIVNNTQILSQTIDDFANFHSSKKEKVNFLIDDAIEQVFSLVWANLKNKNIIIEKEIESITCDTYKNELVQVLLNIINNAKDALIDLKTSKYIFIQITKQNDKCLINIYDNAGGIKNDIIERIFEPYFTTKFKSKGTGIGLYMSKNIVENSLKGTINVENYSFTHEKLNYNGAKFTIVLPIQNI